MLLDDDYDYYVDDVEDGDDDDDYEDGLSVSVCQCYSVGNGSKTIHEVCFMPATCSFRATDDWLNDCDVQVRITDCSSEQLV